MITFRTLFVTITNLGDIAAFFGEGAAGRVLAEVGRRIDHEFDARFQVEEIENWGITVSTASFEDSEQDWARVDAMVHSVSAWPILYREASIVVALNIKENRPHLGDVQRISAHSSPAEYQLDMSVAASAYRALSVPRIRFAEQAVRKGRETDLLYTECLVRLSDHHGRPLMPGAYVPALERLGLTRCFDRQIVMAVIDRLRRDRDHVLGCNISALSASIDFWWKAVFPRLLASAGVADRLVIEVTESARPTSLEEATLFVDHLKSTGCRVALDDFGAGFSSIGFARRAKFDIIKIDGSYVRNKATGEDVAPLLEHLLTLARDVAREVVVEGIETEADLIEACAAGADWLQGYLITQPSSQSTGQSSADIISLVDRQNPSLMEFLR